MSIGVVGLNRARILLRPIVALLLCAITGAPLVPAERAQPPTALSPAEVAFPSGELQLGGFIWKPEGAGPFPAVLWNHGSEKLPGWVPQVAPAFVGRRHVFFIPHRRGHGRSPGPYIQDQLAQAAPVERGRVFVRLQEVHLGDQLAALTYLKGLPFVDTHRLAVAGCSYGGIQTVLAAARSVGYRAAVNFAGAAQSWRPFGDLRTRLLSAARDATVPIYFIQAANDFDLTPSQVLGAAMQKAGKQHVVKIYPAFGATNADGHAFCVRGVDIWAVDVFPFLNANLR